MNFNFNKNKNFHKNDCNGHITTLMFHIYFQFQWFLFFSSHKNFWLVKRKEKQFWDKNNQNTFSVAVRQWQSGILGSILIESELIVTDSTQEYPEFLLAISGGWTFWTGWPWKGGAIKSKKTHKILGRENMLLISTKYKIEGLEPIYFDSKVKIASEQIRKLVWKC